MKAFQQWLQQSEWSLAGCEYMAGGYAAELYKVTLLDAAGQILPAVYKKLARGRESELYLYTNVLSSLPVAVPKLLGIVQAADEIGLLMEYGGQTVKPLYQNSPPHRKKQILTDLITLLAELHTACEPKAEERVKAGAVFSYPYTSSIEWGRSAVQTLESLSVKGFDEVTPQTIAQVRAIAKDFYPRYSGWTNGRSTMTHGDTHMENILFDQGKFQLIDWEWASISVPQRDISILLQDVLEDDLHTFAWHSYQAAMKERGWEADSPQFEQGFFASMVDNTLMMLGWEIKKYLSGFISRPEIEMILAAKVRWIQEYYERLLA